MCQGTSLRRTPRLWPYVFAFALMCRIGEAANPGPVNPVFVLGACNPSGLKGKAPYVVSQLAHGDLWAFSETHLCSQAIHAFRSSLHFARSPFPYCIGGHPVPAQNNRVFHAAWRGVAVLSKFPTREVPHMMPTSIHASSRTLITTTLVGDVWLTGGTVYGEPESSTYPHYKVHNEELLHHVAGHVCHLASGPRFLAGDWNCEMGALPVFDVLEAAGFKDLQDLAHDMWGQPVAHTCKHSTRKDFCFVSKELQVLLKAVHVSHDIFPDHAVLSGTFAGFKQLVPRTIWTTPNDMPWPAHWEVDPTFWKQCDFDPDTKYQLLWQHIEDTACKSLPFEVPDKSKGRAATRLVQRKLAGKVPPPKKARPGDVQPHYVCASFRHSQWLRQTRRLQAYMRHVQAQSEHTEHARQIWGSILRATGFSPSFVEWWPHNSHVVHGTVSTIPLVPPEFAVVLNIYESMVMAFRAFEKELHQASRAYARQRRDMDPNVIFHDLKTFQNRGINVLLKPQQAQVEQVHPQTLEIVLDKPVAFDLSKPVFCSGAQLDIIHAEADALWVSQVDSIEVGSTISQLQCKGTDEELFKMFLETWKVMWDRHREVSPGRWDVILQFARDKLRRQSLSWPAIDVNALAYCIQHKRKTTSGGLDGVSLHDLQALPVAALQNFIYMFEQAEDEGLWPAQVIAGRVSCLAKTAEPQHALDFRPITIFSILYRCWGTFHARHAIRAIDQCLPLGLYGSRPQRYAGQIWSQMLWSIEMAYELSTPLCGIIADIQKAFNFLPRAVVIESCALLGIPFSLLRGWSGALSLMSRRFQVNGSISPPAYSNCGLPEGCALSCLGMMVIDILFHEWMVHFFPLCQPMSYVDDWQVIVADPHSLPGVFHCLERFTEALDLLLDQRKTHVWSVSADGRSFLRTQGFGTVAFSKSLGAHVQYTRQHTNKCLMDRIHKAGPLWSKLRLSACPYRQKVRAIKSAAWPRCLHAVAATTVSTATYTSLRAGALKGLKSDAAGANATVHLGLIEDPTNDPQVWAIIQTFRLARDCGDQHRVEEVLASLALGRTDLPANSITHTLLTRIQSLGWHVNESGHIVDMVGSFSLFLISTAELQYRVEIHWPLVVHALTEHRPCFQGLDRVDPRDTRSWLKSLPVSDQALFRKLLNGTHITQDGKQYCQESNDDGCRYCGNSDNRFHRFWLCEHFEFARSDIPPHVHDMLPDLPEATTCSGWSLAPTTQHEWNSYFAQLVPTPIPKFDLPCKLNFFTDGSCHLQHYPNRRFAGWAIVFGDTDAVHDYSGSTIVDSGVLPGLLQSPVRAEIYAVLRVMQITRFSPQPVMIWSDSELVVKRFRKLLLGGVRQNSAHSDLWNEIFECLQDRVAATAITHVSAHRHEGSATNFLQEWCFRHNALADKQAVRANFHRPQHFWELFDRHVCACINITEINRIIQRVLLTISREVVRQESPMQDDQMPQDATLPPPQVWRPIPTFHPPDKAIRWYGDPLVRTIASWFWQVVHGSREDLIWVSHFQLYVDFMLTTGEPGPVHQSKWRNGKDIQGIRLLGFSFRQRARWFTKCWKEILRHAGIQVEFAYGKPFSQVVQMYTGCAALPWPLERLSIADEWMLSKCHTTFRRQARIIDSLPFADADDRFQPFLVTTTVA